MHVPPWKILLYLILMHFSGIQAKIFEVSSKTGDNVGKIITQFQSNSIITFVLRRKHSVTQV